MQEIEFSKDLSEMNDAELRATLREFRGEYSDAKSKFDELQDKVSEYKETIEEQARTEKQLEDLKPKFASMFAEMKDLDQELVEDKFSVSELVEELEEAHAFSSDPVDVKDAVDDVDDDVDEDGSKFSEREQKSKNVGDDKSSKHQDRIDRFFKEKKMIRTY